MFDHSPLQEDPDAPPAGSPLRRERRGNRLILTLPPLGLWRRRVALEILAGGVAAGAMFGIVWAGDPGAFTPINPDAPGAWTAWWFCGAWTVLVLSLTLLIVELDRSLSGSFVVVDDTLRVEYRFVLRKHWQWAREEIAGIAVAQLKLRHPGRAWGSRPPLCLKISPREGPPVELGMERTEAELRWVVRQLRQALRLEGSDPDRHGPRHGNRPP